MFVIYWLSNFDEKYLSFYRMIVLTCKLLRFKNKCMCCNIVIYTLIAVALSSCQKRIDIFPSSNCVPKVTTCYEAIPKLRLIIENKDQARVGFSVCYSNPQLYYP